MEKKFGINKKFKKRARLLYKTFHSSSTRMKKSRTSPSKKRIKKR